MRFEDFRTLASREFFCNSDLHSMHHFVKQLDKRNRLTNEQFTELVRNVQTNKDAEKSMERIIKSMQSVVFLLAKKYAKYNSFFDYVSEANYSIIRAVNTFAVDDKRSSFMSYAVTCILNNSTYTNNNSLIPTIIKKYTLRLKKFINKFYQENGYEPTREDIRENFPDIQDCEIELIEHYNKEFVSLDDFTTDNDNMYLKDKYLMQIDEQYSENNFEDKVDFEHDKNVLLNKITEYLDEQIAEYDAKEHQVKDKNYIPIPYKVKYIIEHLYGLNGKELMPLEDIAKAIGIGKERCKALHQETIAKMKKYYEKAVI